MSSSRSASRADSSCSPSGRTSPPPARSRCTRSCSSPAACSRATTSSTIRWGSTCRRRPCEAHGAVALARGVAATTCRPAAEDRRRPPSQPCRGSRSTYDDLQEVQHLSYQGVLTDTDKATLAALSSSPVLPALLDEVQTKGKEFPLVKGHCSRCRGRSASPPTRSRRILEDAELSLDTAPLSLPNVSLLYRYGLLAKA